MEFRDAIKTILKSSNYSQRKMSECMGYANASGLSEQLRNNNMSIKVLLKLVNVAGYEIVLRPSKSYKGDKRKAKEVVIDKAKE